MAELRRDSFSTCRMPRCTRRTTFRAGGIGLAAAMGLRVPSVVAQSDELPQVIADFVAGWAALAPDQFSVAYAEDGTAGVAPFGTEFVGPDAIRDHYIEFFAAYSDMTMEFPTVFATESWAALEWVMDARYTGTQQGLPPGTGQHLLVQGATVIEHADGQLQRTLEYFDVYGMLIQLGILPPPGPPEATPDA